MPDLTLADSIERAIRELHGAGVASPRFDAWALASHVTGTAMGHLQAQSILGSVPWDSAMDQAYANVIARRVNREPLWRITGKAPFIGLELEVGPGVFTPRPETELLAHQALEESASFSFAGGELTVVDLCAGTGAVGLWIALQLPHVTLLAVEISPDASAYLQRNVERYAPGRAEVLTGDLDIVVDHDRAGSVDIVVSNPPYLIPGEEVDHETATADPPLALYGGEDGLEVIRRVVGVSSRILRPGGVMFIEHGVGHRDALHTLCQQAGFAEIHTEVDLLGRDRFTRARFRG